MKKKILILFIFVFFISFMVVLYVMVGSHMLQKELRDKKFSFIINCCDEKDYGFDSQEPYFTEFYSRSLNANSNITDYNEVSIKGYSHIHYLIITQNKNMFCTAISNEGEPYILQIDKDMNVINKKRTKKLSIALYEYSNTIAALFEDNGVGVLYKIDVENESIAILADDIDLTDINDCALNSLFIKNPTIVYKKVNQNETWHILCKDEELDFKQKGVCFGFTDDDTLLFCKDIVGGNIYLNVGCIYKYNYKSGSVTNKRLFLHRMIKQCAISDDGRYIIILVSSDWTDMGGFIPYIVDLKSGIKIRLKGSIGYPVNIQWIGSL